MKKIITITLLLFISLTLVGCKEETIDPIYDEIIFVVLGDKDMSVELDGNYIEKGYLAKNGSTDISEFVVIESNVDVTTSGTYEVTYTLDYNDKITVLTRNVNVLFANTDCDDVKDTNLQVCSKVWTSYLHTVVSLKVYIDKSVSIDTTTVLDDVEEILALYNNISDKYEVYPGFTSIKTINDNPTDTHVISEELFDLIEFSLEHQPDVDNIFNIALGPVINVWHDYREDCTSTGNCAIPSIEELEAQNMYTDQTKIILDRANLTITMDENMSIDLGGVSKGYISGIIEDYLAAYEIHGFILNNGESNISVGGNHPTRDGGEFLIAITDPTNVLPYYATAFLSAGEQLVTSGDYQQYFIVDGQIYHHIISGISLFPDRNCRSVSIITSDAGLADLYSTAIFLMTIEDGIEFVDGIDGLEAIWYGIDGTIHFSENFESEHLGAITEK